MGQKRSADADVDADADAGTLSVEEARLYDRQIRLWGMAAQQRMRTARILIAGCTGLANEVIKNIVLAGVGSVMIADPSAVSPRDLGAQFFLREEDIGKLRAKAVAKHAQLLNPRVKVDVYTESVTQMPEHVLKNFDLICVIDNDPEVITRINAIARAHDIGFWAASVIGMRGFIFTDLGDEHTYTPPARAESDTKSQQPKQKTQNFCRFDAVLKARFGALKLDRRATRKMHPLFFALLVVWKFWTTIERKLDADDVHNKVELAKIKNDTMRQAECDPSFLPDDLLDLVSRLTDVTTLLHAARSVVQTLGHEAQPACAVLGGFLSQELLKALSRGDASANNMMLYDAWTATAQVMRAG